MQKKYRQLTYQHHFRHLARQKVHAGAVTGGAVEGHMGRRVLSTGRHVLVTTAAVAVTADVLARNHHFRRLGTGMLGIRQTRGSGRFDHREALVVIVDSICIVIVSIIWVERGGDRRVTATAGGGAAVGLPQLTGIGRGNAQGAVVSISPIRGLLSLVAVPKGLETLGRQGDDLQWLQQQLRRGSVV